MEWFIVGIGFHLITPFVIEVTRGWFPSLVLPSKTGHRSPFPFRWKLLHLVVTLELGAFFWGAATMYEAGWTNLRPLDGFYWYTPFRVALEMLIILAFLDCNFYWVHRLLHRNRWLYRHIHYLHHKAINPTAWHANMQHPLEMVFQNIVPSFVLLFLPFSVEGYILAQIQANMINIGGHAGYEMTRMWLGRVSIHGLLDWVDPRRRHLGRVWATTAHHDVHHRKISVNFSLYFTWWDALGKTEEHTELTDEDNLKK